MKTEENNSNEIAIANRVPVISVTFQSISRNKKFPQKLVGISENVMGQ